MDFLSNRRTFLTLIVFVSFGLCFYFFAGDVQYSTFNFTPYYGSYHQLRQSHEDYANRINKHGKLEQAYLVDTSNCQIIRWPLLDDQTRPLYKNMTDNRLDCHYGKSRGIRINRFNLTGIRVINNSNKSIECFKSEIRRKIGTDDKIYYLPSVKFNPNSIQYFSGKTSAVKVTCFIDKGHKGYEKVIALIPDVENESADNNNSKNNLPNILFFGIDSVSRINFDRHFPLSAKVIEKHKFYTMFGYNKVADNTFVNLTPLLTGFYLEDIWNETISKNVFVDYFPFIWKEFKSRGHQTLLVEDAPQIATFNYLKKGFEKPPTDYYLRPFSLAIEQDIKKDCYLDQTEIDTYYEYIYDFVKRMDEKNQNYFGFTFMARLTHGLLNSAGYVDPMTARLLNRLFDNNLMSNTILVFFSDHGIRFGPIRETLSGKIEERMPFMHIYLPEQWRNQNVSINSNRLTTPFDIHATLKHIIDGVPDLNLRYGLSLFEEIPENRSCDSVPILEHWCSCQSSQPISDLTKVEPISQFVVKSVNQLVNKNYGQLCADLTLKRTVSAFEQHLSDKLLKFRDSKNDVIDRHVIYGKKIEESVKHILVTLEVSPSDALFESTVSINQKSNQMTIIGEVSRINVYGNQSDCIDNQFVRRYCFCKKYSLIS